MTRHTRRLFAAAAMLAAAAPLAALGLPRAASANSLDVYALHGSAAAVRVTVQTGYSFVVEPDAMIPRAAATIEADQVMALASPLDPGDSVDALPGLGVPTAENDIQQGASTPFPGQIPIPPPLGPVAVPSPLAGSTPPPQFSGAVGSGISTFATTFNPALTANYEHAQASYPDPLHPGRQRASFPVGSSGNVPPDFTDPAGTITAHSSSGSVYAAEGSGIADAGVGSAVTIPALGLHVGRVSAHVETHGGSGAATSTVVTTLHDVDITPPGSVLPSPLPPGTSLLHIGTLVLSAVTERAAGAAKATSHTDLQASGVSVAGVAARLDHNGLSVNGSPSPLNAVAQQLIAALNSPQCTPSAPVGIPNGPGITSVPALRIGAPTLQNTLSHNGNESSVSMTGLTLCVATTAPVPNTSGAPASTPTIYTITLGNASSRAYGASLPSDTGAGLQLSPAMPETGTLGGGGSAFGLDSTGGGISGAAAAPPTAKPPTPPQQTGDRSLLATLTGGVLSRKVVAIVAMLTELALLSTLWTSWLRARRPRVPDDASPTTRMDLI